MSMYSDAAARTAAGRTGGINLIGILNEHGRHGRGFEAAHTGLTKLIAACQASGTRRLLR